VKKRAGALALFVFSGLSLLAQSTDFFQLVQTGTPRAVQDALDAGADINAADEFGDTPLILAAGGSPPDLKANRNPEVIATLLKAGADVNALGTGWTPLMAAARANSPEVVAMLIKAGANVNFQNSQGTTPLMLSIYNDNPEVIAILLDAGADTKAKDYNGETAFDQAQKKAKLRGTAVLAALSPDFLERVKYATLQETQAAIDSGADMEARNDDGATPLMIASAYNQDPAVVAALIKAGADVNASDKHGFTPLMWAAARNPKPVMITTLLGAGASLDARDEDGASPLKWAIRNQQDPPIIAALIAGGFDPKARDVNGLTPLMWAAMYGQKTATISALISEGADVNARDGDGWTPLMYALCSKGEDRPIKYVYPSVILGLLDSGADARVSNEAGENALYFARKVIGLKGTEALERLENAAK
jgi:uncharacterized protein